MPCFTVVEILEDTAVNRRAREELGFPLEEELTATQNTMVKIEAGIIRARTAIKRLDPKAIVRRKGNKLQIEVRR